MRLRLVQSGAGARLLPGLATAAVVAAAAGWALPRLLAAYVPTPKLPQPADVIVVLGHPAHADGSPSPSLREEVALAAALYHAGIAPALLLTGGAVHNNHAEAVVMAQLARRHGIPPEAITLDTAARDTVQNARHCHEIMRQRGWQTALVVTTPYHVRRADHIFAMLGIDHQMAYPLDSHQLTDFRSRFEAFYYEVVGQAWLAAALALRIELSWQTLRHSS